MWNIFGTNSYSGRIQEELERYLDKEPSYQWSYTKTGPSNVDLKQEPGKLTIKVSLPGLKREQVSVSHLVGEILVDYVEKNKEKCISIRIPATSSPEAVSAEMADGLLTIAVVTDEKAKSPRTAIRIKSA